MDLDGIAAVQTRIAAMSVPPARVAQLQDRFESLLTRAIATTAATAPLDGADSASPDEGGTVFRSAANFVGAAPANGGTSAAASAPSAGGTTSTAGAGAWTAAPVLGTPRILSAPSSHPAPTSGVSALGTPGGPIPATAPRGGWADRIPIARGQPLAPYIQGVADRYGLDPALLAAVFWTESGYQPDVVSSAGAVGLGQLMPGTAATLGVTDRTDPMQNMDGSARLYRYLIDKYGGNLDLAISAYACGEGAVARAGGVPSDFARNYITKLLGRRDYLNGLRPTAP